MRMMMIGVVLSLSCFCVAAQEPGTPPSEQRVALSEKAVALDGNGVPALEGTLKTIALNGAEDSPVTNIRLIVRNSSNVSYAFVSGLVTFYDSASVRCGEGLFKADALSVAEAFETDTPGIRIRCAPSTWRIVASNLLPKATVGVAAPAAMPGRSNVNLMISVDGEEHPIQLGKPLVVRLGDVDRTIVLREAP
ncbi:MAG TPA: hypothetical protein VK208_14795 [Pyrinomonadaceae bacterium]|nr:hypothetical protein [Pyrinomonadaceae bacterium]